jgi:hypothetical protein
MAVSSGRALSPRADGDDSANEVVAAVRSILSRGSSKAWSRKLASLPACRLEEGRTVRPGPHHRLHQGPHHGAHAGGAPLQAPPRHRHQGKPDNRRNRALRSLALTLTRVGVCLSQVQARVRAYMQRKRYLKALQSATQIEAQTRRMLQLLRFKRIKAATGKIQKTVRMFVAKRRVKALRTQFKNKPPRLWARQIQRVYR